jgi:hypothetical protein
MQALHDSQDTESFDPLNARITAFGESDQQVGVVLESVTARSPLRPFGFVSTTKIKSVLLQFDGSTNAFNFGSIFFETSRSLSPPYFLWSCPAEFYSVLRDRPCHSMPALFREFVSDAFAL